MNCNYKDKIISYIENDLTKQEMSDFKKELDKSLELQMELNEMKATWMHLKIYLKLRLQVTLLLI